MLMLLYKRQNIKRNNILGKTGEIMCQSRPFSAKFNPRKIRKNRFLIPYILKYDLNYSSDIANKEYIRNQQLER